MITVSHCWESGWYSLCTDECLYQQPSMTMVGFPTVNYLQTKLATVNLLIQLYASLSDVITHSSRVLLVVHTSALLKTTKFLNPDHRWLPWNPWHFHLGFHILQYSVISAKGLITSICKYFSFFAEDMISYLSNFL